MATQVENKSILKLTPSKFISLAPISVGYIFVVMKGQQTLIRASTLSVRNLMEFGVLNKLVTNSKQIFKAIKNAAI